MKKSDCHINVFFSADDGGWIAEVPDLKSCSAIGGSPEEALREVLTARDVWLAAAKKHRKPVPPPRFRPAIYAVTH